MSLEPKKKEEAEMRLSANLTESAMYAMKAMVDCHDLRCGEPECEFKPRLIACVIDALELTDAEVAKIPGFVQEVRAESKRRLGPIGALLDKLEKLKAEKEKQSDGKVDDRKPSPN